MAEVLITERLFYSQLWAN